jgi:hypothetical protein
MKTQIDRSYYPFIVYRCYGRHHKWHVFNANMTNNGEGHNNPWALCCIVPCWGRFLKKKMAFKLCWHTMDCCPSSPIQGCRARYACMSESTKLYETWFFMLFRSMMQWANQSLISLDHWSFCLHLAYIVLDSINNNPLSDEIKKYFVSDLVFL